MIAPLSDRQLLELLTDLESDRIARKESLKGKSPDAVREAACAFANDRPGHHGPGVTFIGARDDGSPNLGAINRAALVASGHVIMPVAPDLFSLQGLKNLGPTLRRWRDTWRQAREKAPESLGEIPSGAMAPIGYVLTQHFERRGEPTRACRNWAERLPGVYAESVLARPAPSEGDEDRNRISQVKHFRSLMPMAMAVRKPMLLLKPADGAIGAHQSAVRECHDDVRRLVEALVVRAGIEQAA